MKRHASLLAAVLAAACASERDVAGEPGQPLPGLEEEDLGRFLLGKALFERLTTPEEGLGPLFNAERCSACHNVPATGGSGPALVVKATRFENGRCDLLVGEGGDNIQQRATAPLVARGIAREEIPRHATATARVTGPPLFGLGLVETIRDATILAREDAGDANGDSISGRAARTTDGRLGRFGRKGEAPTIPDFIDTALRFELGLTTPAHPTEETVNGVPIPSSADPMPDPEIDERGLRLLAEYVRFLAPPARDTPESGAARDSVARGEELFAAIGCASCHVPAFRTPDRKRVALYSDLLLHDVGPGLADVCGTSAGPSEYRTAPLWGLRYREALLHDGRAHSVPEAVALHGGEASAARDGFVRLSAEQRALLLRFVGSL